MRERPRPQELYRHFKGKLYQIITIARHTETDEELVVYQALYGDFRIYCRELSIFLSEVDRERYPEATQRYRFTRVEAQEKRTDDGGRGVTEDGSRNDEESPEITDQREYSRSVAGVIPAEREGKETVRSSVMSKTIEEEAEELHMDPLVVRFLDADSASGRIQVLEELRGRVTDEMIDIMAVAAGLDVPAGETWQRYNDLRDSLRTIERFETSRLRNWGRGK